MSWKALRANLVEIEAARNSGNLIAVGKSRVLCKNSGWGRFIHFFSCGRKNSERVETALQNIRQAFQERIARLDDQRCLYFHHLGRELRGERFSIKDREKAEQELLQFCLHMRPLMRDVRLGKDVSYLNLLLDSKNENLKEWKKIFTVIRVFQRTKNLEVTIKTPLPYRSLLKAASSQPIKAREKEQISNWLTRLGRSRNQKLFSFKGEVDCKYGKIRFMHRLLRDLVALFKELIHEDSPRPAVAVLEDYLRTLGCPVFTAQDSKHLEWAKSLHPGAVIKAKGIDYELGEILQKDNEHPEIPIVFALKDHPGLELVIDHNEAIGYLKNHHTDLLHCGIIQPEPVAIEEKGRALIQERLPYATFDIRWRSTEKKLDKDHDIPAAKPIIELVQELISRPFTPRPLTRESFGFNEQGEMRARHLLTAGDKSWDDLEYFVFEAASDLSGKFYKPVYDYIMKQSGLEKHVKWKFEK